MIYRASFFLLLRSISTASSNPVEEDPWQKKANLHLHQYTPRRMETTTFDEGGHFGAREVQQTFDFHKVGGPNQVVQLLFVFGDLVDKVSVSLIEANILHLLGLQRLRNHGRLFSFVHFHVIDNLTDNPKKEKKKKKTSYFIQIYLTRALFFLLWPQ